MNVIMLPTGKKVHLEMGRTQQTYCGIDTRGKHAWRYDGKEYDCKQCLAAHGAVFGYVQKVGKR